MRRRTDGDGNGISLNSPVQTSVHIFFCFSLMLFAFADVELARWRRF